MVIPHLPFSASKSGLAEGLFARFKGFAFPQSIVGSTSEKWQKLTRKV